MPSLLSAGNYSKLQEERTKSADANPEHVEDIYFILWLDAVGTCRDDVATDDDIDSLLKR